MDGQLKKRLERGRIDAENEGLPLRKVNNCILSKRYTQSEGAVSHTLLLHTRPWWAAATASVEREVSWITKISVAEAAAVTAMTMLEGPMPLPRVVQSRGMLSHFPILISFKYAMRQIYRLQQRLGNNNCFLTVLKKRARKLPRIKDEKNETD